MKSKRITLLILSASILVMLFSGCKKTEPTVKEDPSGMKTYDFSFNIWGGQDQFQGGQLPKYYDDVAKEINKRISKELGFKLNFKPLYYPAESMSERVNVELASNKQIELIKMMSTVKINDTYVSKGTTTDLTQYINESAPEMLAAIPKAAWNEFTINGKIHALPTYDFPYNTAGWIRGDWLKKLGAGVPKNLSELESLLAKIKTTDLDGNGKNDEIPLLGNYHNLIQYIFGMYTEKPGDYINNGKYYSYIQSPGMKPTLEVISKWYKAGYLDDSMFLDNVYQVSANLFAKDKAGIEISNIWNLQYGSLNSVYNSRPDMEFKFLPTLEETKAWGVTNVAQAYSFVPKSCPYPDIVVKYVNWMFKNEENYTLTQGGLGIQGKTFEMKDGSPAVPKAELDAGISEDTILSGPYTNMQYVKWSLNYLPKTTPQQTKDAYKWAYNITEKGGIYQYISTENALIPPNNLQIMSSDAQVVINQCLQKVIKGTMTYEEMISEWTRVGGPKICDNFTEQLKEKGVIK